MEVIEAMRARRSIRKYEKREVLAKVMAQLLESASLAPSANNRQDWKIVVVTDAEMLGRLVTVAGGQEFVGECSAFLAGVIESSTPFAAVDVTIALDHLSLRAVELGLGTCWIGDFEEEPLKEALGVPSNMSVPICMTLGYPAHSPSARKRKGPSELFMSNRWGRDWS
jgi:nitroreductase